MNRDAKKVSRSNLNDPDAKAVDSTKSDSSIKSSDDSGSTLTGNLRTNEMVFIPGGEFTMGTNEPVFAADGEMPARRVTLDSFYMDKYEVSNREFKLFVDETNFLAQTQ